MTGSAHDASAFEHTGAKQDPEWFFEGQEFAWVDSAYPCTKHTIPVHKEPASLHPDNAVFDRYVSHLRVRSEHCMGALKGRFQCLRGLRVHINSKSDHHNACRWITAAIILHNLVIDAEGEESCRYFGDLHIPAEEVLDSGMDEESEHVVGELDGEAKRHHLIQELLAYRQSRVTEV
jgi:DDE superfamily endonuclease